MLPCRRAAARLGAAAVLGLLAAPAPLLAQHDRGGDAAAPDPWSHAPDRRASDALERLEETRRELNIVAEPAGELDPCVRSEGPNFVNFIRRGAAPGEPTYMYGLDLCTRRPFVYEEPTRSGVIVGFDANPPAIHWEEDLSDDRNLRGDRFPVEVLAGVDMLFGTSTLDFGETANGSVDFAAAPSLGLRVERFRATYSRAVLPLERSWLVKLSVAPFRRGPPKQPAAVARPAPDTHAQRTIWFEPLEEPCNATGVGFRGMDRFRIGNRTEGQGYPVELELVSYCTQPHRLYRVKTVTDRTWFSQVNNTYPKFAAWEDIPRGGVLNNLSFSVGFGEILADVFNVDFPTNVIYVGLGYAFGDSRWRVDAGRLFSGDELELVSAGVPVSITTDGWTVQIQRALHLEFLE